MLYATREANVLLTAHCMHTVCVQHRPFAAVPPAAGPEHVKNANLVELARRRGVGLVGEDRVASDVRVALFVEPHAGTARSHTQ